MRSLPLVVQRTLEGIWALQAYINSLQSSSQKVCGSIGIVTAVDIFRVAAK